MLWRHQMHVDAVLRNACCQQVPPVDPAVLVGIETGEAPLKLSHELGAADAVVLVAIEVETPRHRALAAKPDGCPFRQLDQRQIAVAVVVGDAEHALRSGLQLGLRSEEHTSELQSLMRISYAVFCLQKKKK